MTWAEVRADAIRKFGGELPHAETEQEVIDAFEAFPSAVLRLIDEVADAHAQGKVRSCWAVLRSRLAGATSFRDVEVDAGTDRDKAVRRAESWIRNCGVHFDLEREVDDELFGILGSLRAYAGDELLRQRLLGLWRGERPRGERCEREVEERAAAYVESRDRVRSAVSQRQEAKAK